MCGICGIVSPNVGAVDPARVLKMREAIAHRGPDGAGLYVDPTSRVGLGHRRLSIIDLSEAGGQPMANETGSLWLVLNGEIYNYLELASELKRAGHRFRSRTDSEVVVHAYEEWGLDCLTRFIGMFAFALWDTEEQTVVLACDPLGIKPLYFKHAPDEFLFGSEAKAVLAGSPESPRPNLPALYDLLTLTRFDHDHTTLFDGVSQVKPGHYVELRIGEWTRPTQSQYWSFSHAGTAERYNYREPVEQFRALLDDSIRLQLRSDVPVGLMLSGGLDSSALLASASVLGASELHSFSAVYPGTPQDERTWIDCITDRYPTTIHFVTPSAEKWVRDIGRFVRAQETPSNGPGPFTEWCVAEAASGVVKVLLSGQGPDETLGGYSHFYESYLQSALPDRLREGLAGLRQFASDVHEIAVIQHRPAAYYYLATLLPSRERLVRFAKRAFRRGYFTPEFASANGARVPLLEPGPFEGPTPLDQSLVRATFGWGLRRLLHYSDRSSMAFSIEARVPYLDHRLVEFCLALPFEYKIRGPIRKFVAREAMKGRVPDPILLRRDKFGFETPAAAWMRSESHFVRDLLNDRTSRNRGIFRPKVIERLLKEHMTQARDHAWDLWRLLTTELWFREFFDR